MSVTKKYFSPNSIGLEHWWNARTNYGRMTRDNKVISNGETRLPLFFWS